VKRFDVAIVGAGPAGCSAAVFLARKGYSVAMIDRSAFPREKLCGDFLNPANWEIFAKLGIRNELLLLAHEKIVAFRISTTSATAVIPFPLQNGRQSFGLGLRRSLLDDLLVRLAKKTGVAVGQGCKPGELSRDSSGWILSCGHDYAEAKIHAKLLIGADGRNSWVAYRLGLAVPNERAGKYVAFQLHLVSAAGGINGNQGEVQIHLFPGGYGGLVGLGGGTATLCFVIDKRTAREAATVKDLLKNNLCSNPRLKETLEAAETVGGDRSAYPVYFSPRRCFGEGFLLAGDAARVTEPATGEGVYLALKSGELAAAAADLAFRRGVFSARQLSVYESACRRVFGQRLRMNAFIRPTIRRPSWVASLIKFFPNNNFALRSLVHRVCRAGP